jgi:predicted component of type VI protein secretion system
MQIFRKARWEKALGDRWWNRLPGAMLNLLTVSFCVQGEKGEAMSGQFFHQQPFPICLLSYKSYQLIVLFLALAVFIAAAPALADIRVVNAQGEYRMGDRDTREDAIRIASEAAKRNALEQVATYLESVTVVSDMDVTRDEIRTYTAGLVLVLNQQIATTLDGDVVVVKVDLLAQMDTDEVARAIVALRENEDARTQLVALKQENEQLQEELRSVNQAIGNAATSDQVQQAAQRRKDIINRVQSNAMVSQAWTNWVLVSPVGIPHGLLNSASGLSPANPHIAIAQQIIASREPLGVRQPPAPGTMQPRMPSHELVPPPGGSPGARPFNEIIHRTPSGSPLGDRQSMGPLGQGLGGARRVPQAPPRLQQPGPPPRGALSLGAPGGNR